jgi:hypothetical protein
MLTAEWIASAETRQLEDIVRQIHTLPRETSPTIDRLYEQLEQAQAQLREQIRQHDQAMAQERAQHKESVSNRAVRLQYRYARHVFQQRLRLLRLWQGLSPHGIRASKFSQWSSVRRLMHQNRAHQHQLQPSQRQHQPQPSQRQHHSSTNKNLIDPHSSRRPSHPRGSFQGVGARRGHSDCRRDLDGLYLVCSTIRNGSTL